MKIEHINYALVSKAHTPMYVFHKYWARKPHNVVNEYIRHYTKEGDIVLDPFVGSGVTVIEANKLGRKAMGLDLNPMSIFITRTTLKKENIEKMKILFEKIKKGCKNKIYELYRTKCKKCRNDANILATIWDREKENPIEIRYYCSDCKKRNSKEPDNADLKLLDKIKRMKIPYRYPKTKLFYNSRPFMKKEKSNNIEDLYTKRNMIALSILLDNIKKITNIKDKDFFLLAFTSMVHLASKMCPVAKPDGKGHWSKFSATSFWALQSYWVPPVNMESNVWVLFANAINGKQGIIKAKKNSNASVSKFDEAKNFGELKNNKSTFLKVHNALELKDIIPKNSVDYVFTDPPYGGAVQYFELSTLWASWLNMDINYSDEITINREQDKDFNYYHKMLTASFKQIYDVLKPEKYLTVTFHSTDINVWTSIIKAVVLAGFDLEKIVYQPPARTSAKGLLQPYGSAVGDYYIRFKKPKFAQSGTQKTVTEERYERIIVESAKRIIAERGEPTIYQHILNGIIIELKNEGALLGGRTNPEKIMKKYRDKEFVLIDVKDEKGRKGKKWWFKDPSTISYLERVPLLDRVETAIIDVLHGKIKIKFDEILQEIFIKFPNALTPETQNIKELLSEYAETTSDGKWRLKPIVKQRESEHSKIIYMIAKIGKKLGYDVYIGLREQSDFYNNKKLSEFCSEISPKFRFIPSSNMDRIKQIDVIWYEEDRIKYEFEVENTTAITEAFVRGSNIPHDSINRFIVIPEEREKLLHRKVNEPMIRESIEKDGWKFMFYKDLESLFKKAIRRKKLSDSDLICISREPKLKEMRQENLNNFNGV